MRDYTIIMLEQLSGHINNFDKHNISNWLNQAANQFNATIKESSKEGLIMQFNHNEYHIGAEYFGDNREEKEINMFYNFININYHYGSVSNGEFVANLNYEDDYRQPIFG